MRVIPMLAVAVLLAAALGPVAFADNDTNLARAKGTVPFGSGGHGPFTIPKINDGRLDTLGMWGTGGQAGAFGGVQLGETPVTFNTVRFYLFNGRAAFTGWRIEGSNDCQIDEDSFEATFYDPEVIAADADGQFTNATAKENNVVTVTFKAVSYKYVRLVFVNKSGLLGIPEIQIFNRDDNLTPKAGVNSDKEIVADGVKNTITIAKPAAVRDVLAKLTQHTGNTIGVYDTTGKKLKDSDMLRGGYSVLTRFSAGGADTPLQVEYKCYSIIDSSLPPPVPTAYTPSTRPALPSKPNMTPASAPIAPRDSVNLVEGKSITASIDPARAADLAKPGDGNWFAQQRYPQWLCVDLGAETEFNYVSIRVLAGLSLQRFWIQTSSDGATWKNLVEVNYVRRNTQWNGCFEKQKSRYVRAILIPPSSDVHVKKFVIANIDKPLADKDGQPVPVLKPVFGDVPDFSNLPKAATPTSAIRPNMR